MLYIKKDNTYRWLFYNNQYTPTVGKVTIFKTIKEDNISDIKVFTTPNITHRDNYNIYEFTEVDALSEDVEQGLLHYNLGGFYSVQIFEEDVFSINPTSPVLYTERGYVDIYEQPQPCQTIVSPSNTIYSNEDILWISGMTVKTNGLYSYQDSLYLYTGVDEYESTDFLADLTAGYFEIQSAPKDYNIGYVYISKELIYSSGTLYYVINTYTSTGNLATDVTDGNIIAISGSGGGGLFLPLAGGVMDAGATINFQTEDLMVNRELPTTGFRVYHSGMRVTDDSSIYLDIQRSPFATPYDPANNRNHFKIGLGSSESKQLINYETDLDIVTNGTDRTLVDKGYVDNAIANAGGVTRQTFIVTNVADLTGLTTSNQGDVGIVTSTNESYILTNPDYTNLANWELILAPDSVVSVNGQTGVVVLTTGDILPTLGEDWIIISDGLGGFKESNIDVTTLVTQYYLDANFLSLNGGTLNVGAQIFNIDGNFQTYQDAYQFAIYDNATGKSIAIDANYINFASELGNVTNLGIQSNAGNNVILLPDNSGTLALLSDITGMYLPLDGSSNMTGSIIFDASVATPLWMNNGISYINNADLPDLSFTQGTSIISVNNPTVSTLSLMTRNSTFSNSLTVRNTPSLNNVLVSGGRTGFNGIIYGADYSANYTTRSLIDKGYADLTYAPISHTHTLPQILNTDTANKVIITNGTNLVASTVLLTDLLTTSSSTITTLQSNVSTLQGQVSTLLSDVSTLQSEVLALQNANSYVRFVQHATANPVDSETRFFCDRNIAPSTSQIVAQMFIDVDSEIIGADIQIYASSTAGSNEAWDLYVRVNNTTDYLIQSVTVAGNQRRWVNNAMSVPLVAGDFISIKSVQPVWATNPLSVTAGGVLRFKNL